ncbi:MAG: branched-chain amino acid transport system II carrier protein [Bacteroidota bacterium]
MQKTKHTIIIAFALFSLFFGAGNLILPPLLGFKAGEHWFIVALGFCISAVLLPLLGILAHAKLQGTMLDFGKKVSPAFSLLYCVIVYAISVSLPAPRTASVTHEMAFQPFFNIPSWVTSLVYFTLVFIFVINRAKLLDIIGKFLTPLIIGIIVAVIGIGLFGDHLPMTSSKFDQPIIGGLLEGYQTFDAIGAVVIGGVLIISINLKGYTDYHARKALISRAGMLSGMGLFIIYTGLIATGALYSGEFELDITRTALLSGISIKTLGTIGRTFLSVLVALACFTTAVGIITGTSDFFKGLLNNSGKAYTTTALISCILGVLIGQFDVHYIIAIAVPALMFIYPVTIVMVLLHILPEKYTRPVVFKWVIYTTLLFSLPDFIAAIGYEHAVITLKNTLLFGHYNIAWSIPAVAVFLGLNSVRR